MCDYALKGKTAIVASIFSLFVDIILKIKCSDTVVWELRDGFWGYDERQQVWNIIHCYFIYFRVL